MSKPESGFVRLSDVPIPDPITLQEYRLRIAAKAKQMRRDHPRAAKRMTAAFTCLRCRKQGRWSPGQTFDDGLCVECQWELFYSPAAITRMRANRMAGYATQVQ